MGTQTRAAVNIYAMLIYEYVGRRLSECRWAKAKVAPFSLAKQADNGHSVYTLRSPLSVFFPASRGKFAENRSPDLYIS